MSAYFDTSFLFSIYVKDKHTPQTVPHLTRLNGPLKIGSLLYFEFCHSVLFSIARKGLPEKDGLEAILDRVVTRFKHLEKK